MFKIHLYEKDDWTFPKFPVNSYETQDKEMVENCLHDLLNNHDSGISRILIENDEFADISSVTYIPQELKDKKWVPDINKRYECHWYYTNPADPADPGEDILIYIEEIEEDVAKKMEIEYISKINNILPKLSLEQLKDLSNYLERRY